MNLTKHPSLRRARALRTFNLKEERIESKMYYRITIINYKGLLNVVLANDNSVKGSMRESIKYSGKLCGE